MKPQIFLKTLKVFPFLAFFFLLNPQFKYIGPKIIIQIFFLNQMIGKRLKLKAYANHQCSFLEETKLR